MARDRVAVMDDQTRERLADALRVRRASFLREALDAEGEIAALENQSDESELEERSQQERSVRLLDRLDERGRRGVEAVTMALDRLAEGTYGLCVDCGTEIPTARLEALPEAERCVPCAEAAERRPPRARVDRRSLSAPREDAVLLDDDEFEALVWETLRTDERLDLEELQVECCKGVVYLSGALPSDAEREIVQKTMTDLAGASNVIDQVRIEPMAWQRLDRTPGLEPEAPPEYETSEADPRSAADETEDVTETNEEGRVYSPPERPQLDEEPE